MASGFPFKRTRDRFISDPIGTQTKLLCSLLRRASDTEWGRRYGFDEIAASRDPVGIYQERVPVHPYSTYRSDVERVRRGEKDIFWPGGFRHFAVSSGTASEGKIIPLSEEMLKLDRRFSLNVARTHMASERGFHALFGRLLSVPGRIEEDPDHPGAMIGEVSGLLALFSPKLVRSCFEAVPLDILFGPNWERKLDAIVEVTISQDIRSIVMVPSWAVVLFRKLIDRFNARYGRNVETVLEVWPNLSMFFSGGVALSSYRSLLEKQIGGKGIDFVESYGASEGFLAFQDRRAATDMLLHLDNGVFLEFIPQGSSPDPERRISLEEVQPGIRYEVIVSTCSGLWAYPVGDVIQFTSTIPHRLVVSGRTSEVMDSYGEAVYGDEAREALEAACRRTGSTFRDYHVAPVALTEEHMPGHQWLVEFEVPPLDVREFEAEIDRYLQRVNRHYVIRREAHAFEAPKVEQLAEGTFVEWLKRNRNQVSAQSKVPRMSDDRRIADEVLVISGNIT